MGRKKIPIEKIEHKKTRLVAFVKRRTGLFSKARELATRCGAEVAIIIFSQSGKAYTFGHPSFDTVLHRYLHRNEEQEKEGQEEPIFIKRRDTIFKRARELSILCEAEVAIMIFSQAGRAYTCGHPSRNTIINKFLQQHDMSCGSIQSEDVSSVEQQPQNQQQQQEEGSIEHTEGSIEQEPPQQQQSDASSIEQQEQQPCDASSVEQFASDNDQPWWDAPIDDLGLDELEEREKALRELNIKVKSKLDEVKKKIDGVHHRRSLYTDVTSAFQSAEAIDLFTVQSLLSPAHAHSFWFIAWRTYPLNGLNRVLIAS